MKEIGTMNCTCRILKVLPIKISFKKGQKQITTNKKNVKIILLKIKIKIKILLNFFN